MVLNEFNFENYSEFLFMSSVFSLLTKCFFLNTNKLQMIITMTFYEFQTLVKAVY